MIKSKLILNWKLPPPWLRSLIIILLVLGIFFRFVNLDRKFYWWDETYTSLRISGYTETELVQQVSGGHVIGIKDLQKYQRPNPEKGFIDTIKSLAVEEPQHPPLYFAIARFWMQWLGSSVAVTRSLSALISLLAFPCIYWLCLELFESSLVGWIAMALIAVSPFHLLYAQQAREYSLWTVTILLSSAALLRAIRIQTKFSWVMYTATLSLGLYAFTFSGFVALGHGVYVIANDREALASFRASRFRLSKTVSAYLFALLVGLLTFAPWLLVIITNSSAVRRSTAWTVKKHNLLYLVKAWISDLSRVFLDLGVDRDSGALLVPLIFFIPILLILVGYSLYYLWRKTPKHIWLFILTLIGVTALSLILPDVIFGGRSSTTARYLIPCYLGVHIAIAYLLATQITFIVNIQRQKLWQLVMIVLVSSGVLSCAIMSPASDWWNTGYYDAEVERIINQATYPLLISDIEIADILSLSYRLDPKVRLQLEPQCYTCRLDSQLVFKPNKPKFPDGFSDVFLYMPSKRLRRGLEKDYKIEPVNDRGTLSRLIH